jgi:hypothetical protein
MEKLMCTIMQTSRLPSRARQQAVGPAATQTPTTRPLGPESSPEILICTTMHNNAQAKAATILARLGGFVSLREIPICTIMHKNAQGRPLASLPSRARQQAVTNILSHPGEHAVGPRPSEKSL